MGKRLQLREQVGRYIHELLLADENEPIESPETPCVECLHHADAILDMIPEYRRLCVAVAPAPTQLNQYFVCTLDLNHPGEHVGEWASGEKHRWSER